MPVFQSAYDHIAENNRKTVLLVALFPLTLCLLVFLACLVAVALVGDEGMLYEGISHLPRVWRPTEPSVITASVGFTFAFIVPTLSVGIVWMLISLYFGDKMMMAFAGAKSIKKKDAPELYRIVENTAMMVGIHMPSVYVIQDDSLNAFATGMSPNKASIAVTNGLMQKLSPLELQGVIAHEIAHICNRDMRLNMLIITGIGFFGFVGDMLLRSVMRGNRRRRNKNSGGQAIVLIFCVGLALIVFNWIFAPIIRMAISRTREYAADATGAKIIHNPKALADALEKIAVDARVEALDTQKNMSVACIASPLAAEGLSSTHPPIQERIRRLRAM